MRDINSSQRIDFGLAANGKEQFYVTLPSAIERLLANPIPIAMIVAQVVPQGQARDFLYTVERLRDRRCDLSSNAKENAVALRKVIGIAIAVSDSVRLSQVDRITLKGWARDLDEVCPAYTVSRKVKLPNLHDNDLFVIPLKAEEVSPLAQAKVVMKGHPDLIPLEESYKGKVKALFFARDCLRGLAALSATACALTASYLANLPGGSGFGLGVDAVVLSSIAGLTACALLASFALSAHLRTERRPDKKGESVQTSRK